MSEENKGLLDGLKDIFSVKKIEDGAKEANAGTPVAKQPAPKAIVKYKMTNMQVYRSVLMILQHKFAFRNREKLAKDLKDFAKKICERVDGK